MKICLSCEGVTDAEQRECAHCGAPMVATSRVLFPLRRGDEDSPSPLLGRVIDGKYRIVGMLGRGGIGAVYRAVHEVSLIQVALKVLHPRWSSRPEFRTWFLAEARKAGRVVHEGCARVLDVGAAVDGSVYIAVEFVEGRTLAEFLATEGPLSAPPLIDLGAQIARAMAAAHSAGVVHRDLSPRNVMVFVREGRLATKILDFGLAITPAPTRTTAALASDHLLDHAGFATPPYSAPEHLAGRDVDGRADLYSLGVILYEALSDSLPVRGNSRAEYARETLEGRLIPLRPQQDCPRGLSRLIEKLLAYEPAERPPTATAVVQALERLRHVRRGWLEVVAVVAAFAAVVALLVAFLPRSVATSLRVADGGALRLSAQAERSAQVLRTSALLADRFTLTGGVFDRLRLLVSLDGRQVADIPLAEWWTGSADEYRWRAEASELVRRLKSLAVDSAMDLEFRVGAAQSLGRARILLDDSPPRVSIALDSVREPGQSLCGSDRVVLTIEDEQVATSRLHLEFARASRAPATIPLNAAELDSSPRTLSELLGEAFADPLGHGSGSMWIVARDRAGNEARSEPLGFEGLDLAAPKLLEVGAPGGGALVIMSADGARLRVRLAPRETGVRFFATAPGEATERELRIAADQEASVDRFDVLLPTNADGSLPAAGVWRFHLVDPVGNRSATREEGLEFQSADPREEIRPLIGEPNDPAHVVGFGDGFVASGGPWSLQLATAPLYEPVSATLARADGRQLAMAVIDARPGHARLHVDSIEGGEWSLTIELVETRTSARRSLAPRSVLVSTLPPQLHLPAGADAVFLPDLVERAVLEIQGATVRQGAGWQLSPSDLRLVRGRVWTRVAGTLVARELSADRGALDPLLFPVAIARGWNEILLEVEDLLGRPLTLSIGDMEYPAGPGPVSVLRFFAHDAPVRANRPVFDLEYAQPLRVALTADLPPAGEFAWRLVIGERRIAPVAVAPTNDEQQTLAFEVPFDVAAAGTGLVDVDGRRYGEGLSGRLVARVLTPAGTFEIPIDVRTIRTTLRSSSLADWCSDLPAALAKLTLVPVPGPGPGAVVPDLVPQDARGRALFRLSPPTEVRNVSDVFVQDSEFTAAQYRAVLDHALPRALRLPIADRRTLIAVGDPLGERRLDRAGLEPHADWPADDEQAIVGVDCYQAWTVIALLSQWCFGDPRVLRLPLGIELEVAGFGSAVPVVPVRYASALRGPGLFAEPLRSAMQPGRNGPWPWTKSDCERVGDFVVSDLGDRIFGLDCGVREWVLDPEFVVVAGSSVAASPDVRSDYPRLLEQARATFEAAPRTTRGAAARGIVRGISAVEIGGFLEADARVSPEFVGVVRELQLRRDGAGLLPGSKDPHLAWIGFRVGAGAAFVRRMRAR
ncbi:MAG: protein kinase [Planctomycetota bacterium]